MSDYKNVFGDLSAVPYLMNQEESVIKLRTANLFSKILYGSDYPVTSAGASLGMSTIAEIIQSSQILDDEEKKRIFYQNAHELLN